MANLSRLRRERMFEFLNNLKVENRHDEKILQSIAEIENELSEKKYGLVWEEHSEQVDEMMVDNVPILLEDKSREIATSSDDSYNFLIEGDNLHSLKLLEKTHHEKIDIIYIDPPYNTGKEFIYDDLRIGKDDGFRHSKWLSFMNERLTLAKELLTSKGAIFISIDDNEEATLKLLCDDIFGAQNYIGLMTLQSNPRGSQNSNYLSYVHEYVLMYAKDASSLITKGVEKSEEALAEFKEVDTDGRKYRLLGLRKRGGDWKREDRPKMYYPIYVDTKTGDCSLEKDDNHTFEVIPKRPTGELSRWTWGKEKFVAERNLLVGKKVNRRGKDISYDIFRKDYIDKATGDEKLTKLKTIWTEKEINYQNARNEIKAIFGNSEVFDFPKPTFLVKRLISIIDGNESATILDFFAGSGTTAQAVLELNKEDSGNRKFILCTNNESTNDGEPGICESVTYPRIKAIITGIRPDGSKYSDGIPANFKYYKTEFVAKDSETFVDDLITHTDEMIQLEYGVQIDKDKYISILTDEEANELFENWDKYPNIKAIYVSRHVILSAEQRKLFYTKDVYIIPDYYYREELREVGE